MRPNIEIGDFLLVFVTVDKHCKETDSQRNIPWEFIEHESSRGPKIILREIAHVAGELAEVFSVILSKRSTSRNVSLIIRQTVRISSNSSICSYILVYCDSPQHRDSQSIVQYCDSR